ncbi:MAG: DnaD domain protein [Defluviitaleaceae bacterium]|nr:DnaD domain protein [Defluviitaleaceae bacterium]
MESIKPHFKFKVASDVFLSPSDLQTLTLLYQPIMGVHAFSLYLTLLTMPKKTAHRHHLLLQIFDEKMSNFLETRNRLEAVGLLDVYEAADVVNYVLKQPLSIRQFFGDAIMRAFLYVKLGAQDFNGLKQMLVTNLAVPAGERVTKRFDDVFDVRPLSRIEPNMPFERDRKPSEQGIELAIAFDATMLRTILVQKGISQEILTPDTMKILNEFAFLYKFDVHELARLVFDGLLPDGSLDVTKIKALARTQFQLINKGEHLKVTLKESKVEHEKATSGQPENGIIPFLEQSPVAFLRFKSGGKPPVPADVKLVEWLYIDQGLPAGVVNVLVDYVLDYTDGSLPKQMIEKIAGQWQRQGINTTQAAMDKVIRTLRKSNQYQKEKQRPIGISQAQHIQKATRVEPIPEWLGQTIDQSQQTATDAAAKGRIEQMRHAFINGGGESEETQ